MPDALASRYRLERVRHHQGGATAVLVCDGRPVAHVDRRLGHVVVAFRRAAARRAWARHVSPAEEPAIVGRLLDAALASLPEP